MTFNPMPDFNNGLGLCSDTTYSPLFQRDRSFLFECIAPFAEQPPPEESTLPTLEPLDAAFSSDVKDDIPSFGFSLPELTQVALASLNKESLSDIRVLAYGYSNKVYSLTFSDGTEAVLRFPHIDVAWKGQGWLGQLLDCEVGTMKYAKQNLPPEFAALVPTIYAWDSDPSNPVGQQYIIMEKMKGVPFSDAWDDATTEEKEYVVEQLAEFTYALHSTGNEFTKFGSIYFNPENDSFYVGPYINRDYEIEIHNPNIDHGPWTNSSEVFLEQLKSRLLYFSSTLHENNRDGDKYSAIVDHLQNLGLFISDFEAVIIDGVERVMDHRSLFHTDLHAKNFLVDSRTMQVTGVLDWEGMGIFPDWISMSIPAFLESQKLSKIWETKNSDELEDLSEELEGFKEYYLFERSRLQPGYEDQVAAYLKLYKLYNAIFVEPEDLRRNSDFDWIVEELEAKNAHNSTVIYKFVRDIIIKDRYLHYLY